jgi:tripeptide aminopeptidase
MINQKRLTDEFCKLVAIDSPSFGERKMADYIKSELTKLGVEVYEDNAGSVYGGNAGNVYGYLKGNIAGDGILFCSHTDTVEPSGGKRAVLHDDGKITSDGTTVLGGDDICGIAAILEALRIIKENNIPHRDIEVLFPIAEEVYIKGTSVFDFSLLKSKIAYVLDLSGEIGTAALRAPSLISFELTVGGKSAHAGFAPQDGINAIAAAAEAIAGIRQGQVDAESTLNIGTISGGTATNIVSDSCKIRGELRSYSHSKALAMLDELREKFEVSCNKYKAELKVSYSVDLTAYNVDGSSDVVGEYQRVCDSLGIKTEYISTFGGSDNNSLLKNGIEGIVIACGYHNAHTVEEYTTVKELAQTSEIVLGLMSAKTEAR